MGEPIDRIDKKILKKWFFNIIGNVRVKEEHIRQINQIITEVLDDFTNNFLEKRQRYFEKTRDEFIDVIKTIIENNGKLSSAAKKFICEIKVPEIKRIHISNQIENIYNSNKRLGGLRANVEYLKKEEFIDSLQTYLLDVANEMSSEYADAYKKDLDSILEKVRSEFETNMDSYSVQLKAKVADKDVMEKLGGKIADAANELKNCQDKLNHLIWEVKGNG